MPRVGHRIGSTEMAVSGPSVSAECKGRKTGSFPGRCAEHRETLEPFSLPAYTPTPATQTALTTLSPWCFECGCRCYPFIPFTILVKRGSSSWYMESTCASLDFLFAGRRGTYSADGVPVCHNSLWAPAARSLARNGKSLTVKLDISTCFPSLSSCCFLHFVSHFVINSPISPRILLMLSRLAPLSRPMAARTEKRHLRLFTPTEQSKTQQNGTTYSTTARDAPQQKQMKHRSNCTRHCGINMGITISGWAWLVTAQYHGRDNSTTTIQSGTLHPHCRFNSSATRYSQDIFILACRRAGVVILSTRLDKNTSDRSRRHLSKKTGNATIFHRTYYRLYSVPPYFTEHTNTPYRHRNKTKS